MSTAHGLSLTPGSEKEKSSVTELPPAQAVPVAFPRVNALIVGATFAADQLNVSVTTACSPSSTCTVTLPEPLSVVARLHDHVPSRLPATVPSPETFEIASVLLPSASLNEPDV